MKREKRTLELVNVREKEIYTREQSGYTFEAITKDGTPYLLFVYKLNDKWHVNDAGEANATVTTQHHLRRDAVSAASELISKVSDEQIRDKSARVIAIKCECVKVHPQLKEGLHRD